MTSPTFEGSAFAAFMRWQLPLTVDLPAVFGELFDWIDANGWIVAGRVDGEPYGGIAPGQRWMHDGTAVSFHVEPSDVRVRYSRLWTGVDGLHDVLVPFAQTGAEGSAAAFWVAPDGIQRIVHLGSGSGSVVACVLATEPIDFLRLLAIGYRRSVGWTNPSLLHRPRETMGCR